jgi:hypothetical protein
MGMSRRRDWLEIGSALLFMKKPRVKRERVEGEGLDWVMAVPVARKTYSSVCSQSDSRSRAKSRKDSGSDPEPRDDELRLRPTIRPALDPALSGRECGVRSDRDQNQS